MPVPAPVPVPVPVPVPISVLGATGCTDHTGTPHRTREEALGRSRLLDTLLADAPVALEDDSGAACTDHSTPRVAMGKHRAGRLVRPIGRFIHTPEVVLAEWLSTGRNAA